MLQLTNSRGEMLLVVTLSVFCPPFFGEAIKIITSQVALSDFGDEISGTHLLNIDPLENELTEFTFCLRFNYKVLGSSGENKGRLLTISKWRNTTSVSLAYFHLRVSEWSFRIEFRNTEYTGRLRFYQRGV